MLEKRRWFAVSSLWPTKAVQWLLNLAGAKILELRTVWAGVPYQKCMPFEFGFAYTKGSDTTLLVLHMEISVFQLQIAR